MPDESNVEIVPGIGDPQSGASKPPGERGGRPWNRAERIHFFVWALMALVVPAVLLITLHLAKNRGEISVQTELPSKALLAFFAALATVVVARLERRPLSDFGIPLRQAFGLKFWEGIVWGFGMLSLILLGLRAGGFFHVDSIDVPKEKILYWALGWGATFLAVSLNEELAFRGYWLFMMARPLRFWRAALFTSVVFGVAHLGNHGENVIGIIHVFVTGMLFCLMIRRTGSLWFAIGYHAAWDWAETFFYGTPDSGLLGVGRLLNSSVHGPAWLTGGTAGPEGSVLSLVALALCAALIHLRFPRVVYPDRPV